MSVGWKMKKGDLLPILDVILRDSYGPVSLGGATSATFRMATPAAVAAGDTPKVEATADIDTDQVVNPGKVTYTWSTGDTDTPGTYWGEIVVLYSSKEITYPNGGYYEIIILENVEENV